MKKISKDKRNKLILVVMMIALVLSGIYFGGIGFIQQRLSDLAVKRTALEGKADAVQRAIHNADQIASELQERTELLATKEKDMASGDYYSWMIDNIRVFKAGYNIDIPKFENAVVSDVKLFPKFSYKQVSLSISGTGYYQDIGKFVADFENRFLGSRILNLELSPGPGKTPEDLEKLSFKMEIVTLIKSDS
jgi:Tfp pilus assembly protein PilO